MNNTRHGSVNEEHPNDLDQNKALMNRIDALKDIASALVREIESLKEISNPDFIHGTNFQEKVRYYESGLIRQVLRLTHGNQRRAASMLGLRHTTLNSKIKRYKIEI